MNTQINLKNSETPLWVQQYNVIKLFFQHLNIRDLTSAGQVCTVWSEVCRNVRKKRWNLPYIMLYSPYVQLYSGGGSKNPVVDDDDDEPKPLLDPNKFSMVFQSSGSGSSTFKSYENILLEGLQNWSEPQYIILIGTIGWQNVQIDRESFSIQQEDDQANLLRQRIFSKIPNIIQGLGILTTGVVSSIPNRPGTVEMEMQSMPIVTCLAIPKIPGLKLKTFTFNRDIKKKYSHCGVKAIQLTRDRIWRQEYKKILNITPEDNIKGILLFHSDKSRNAYVLTAVHEYIKHNPETGFGGGIMLSSITTKQNEPRLTGSGILICCDDQNLDIQVGSIGMFEPGVTPDNLEKLLKFKKIGMDADGTDSFALMFACNGRGSNMHGESNVESALFKKHYPNTPLIGAFTMGEYVHEYIPGDKNILPNNSNELQYSFTTVFVFVSWKKLQSATGGPTTSSSV